MTFISGNDSRAVIKKKSRGAEEGSSEQARDKGVGVSGGGYKRYIKDFGGDVKIGSPRKRQHCEWGGIDIRQASIFNRDAIGEGDESSDDSDTAISGGVLYKAVEVDLSGRMERMGLSPQGAKRFKIANEWSGDLRDFIELPDPAGVVGGQRDKDIRAGIASLYAKRAGLEAYYEFFKEKKSAFGFGDYGPFLNNISKLSGGVAVEFLDGVVEHLRGELDAKVKNFRGCDLARVLFAFSQMGYRPNRLFVETCLSVIENNVKTLDSESLSKLMSALANLRYRPQSGAINALVERAERILKYFEPFQLATMLRGMAVLSIFREQFFDAAYPYVDSYLREKKFRCGCLTSLSQFYKWYSNKMGDFSKGKPGEAELVGRLEKARKAFGQSEVTVSTFQKQVEAVVVDIAKKSKSFRVIRESQEGIFSIDVLVVSEGAKKVVIACEVDGPTHFYLNEQEKSNGATFFKHRMLKAEGYEVVHIGYQEWNRLNGNYELRYNLVEEKLKRAGGNCDASGQKLNSEDEWEVVGPKRARLTREVMVKEDLSMMREHVGKKRRLEYDELAEAGRVKLKYSMENSLEGSSLGGSFG